MIALILKRVREILKKHFEVTKQHDIKDFHWVLTIPALWGKKARDMMREAAYLVSWYNKLINSLCICDVGTVYRLDSVQINQLYNHH